MYLNKYFIRTDTTKYEDISVMFRGVKVLKIDGILARGKAKNIATQEWINSNALDVYVPADVCFESTDIELSFIVSDFDYPDLDVKLIHDAFIDYMTKSQIWLKSFHVNEENLYICLSEYKPSDAKLSRASGANYIMGTLTLKKVNSIGTKL